MRRVRFWRSQPATTYRRSRLPPSRGCVRHDAEYVDGADFDEFRAQLKRDALERAEFAFSRR